MSNGETTGRGKSTWSDVMESHDRDNFTDVERFNDVSAALLGGTFQSANYDPCSQFEFVFNVVLIGTLCLSGFATNTISLLVIRKHQSGLLRCVRIDRLTADFDIFLQATVIADVFLLWTVFIGYVVPSISNVTPLCSLTCRHLAAIHRPLSVFSQVLVVWLTTATLACGQTIAADEAGGGGANDSRHRRSTSDVSSSAIVTAAFAVPTATHSTRKTKLIIGTLFLMAALFAMPKIFEDLPVMTSSSSSSSRELAVTSLADERWYRLLYTNALSLLVIVVPLISLLGVAIGLPTIETTRKQAPAAASGIRGVQHLQVQRRRSPCLQTKDVTNITAALAVLAMLAYTPLVAVLIADWIYGKSSGRRSSCGGEDETAGLDYSNVMFYVRAVGRFMLTACSTLKLPVLCCVGRQYNDCLGRLCCRCDAAMTRHRKSSISARIYNVQQHQRLRDENARRSSSSARVTLISSLSEELDLVEPSDHAFDHRSLRCSHQHHDDVTTSTTRFHGDVNDEGSGPTRDAFF